MIKIKPGDIIFESNFLPLLVIEVDVGRSNYSIKVLADNQIVVANSYHIEKAIANGLMFIHHVEQ